jgi:hypothetical protein
MKKNKISKQLQINTKPLYNQCVIKCTTFLENNVNGMPVQKKNIFFVTQN